MDADPSTFAADILPSPEQLHNARSKLIQTLPSKGIGLAEARRHLYEDLVPGFNRQSQSPYYYGFVTGGTTPAAVLGDNIATQADQSPQVHLPNDTVATDVDDRALSMVCELLALQPEQWPHRIFSTGATASNVLGLACGREFVLQRAAASADASVAELGIAGAMRAAGVGEVRVLTTVPHSSLRKAASIVGLGRASVQDVGIPTPRHKIDWATLEAALQLPRTAYIIAVSCGEVNTGLFATTGADMQRLRQLCDKHGAWLHVDAAFGLLARALPQGEEFSKILEGVAGLELADSIAGDAHKLLNVPYDCGIFLSRHLALGTHIFQNLNATYLNIPSATSTTTAHQIPSPLNLGIENSRRFRALPVYATLSAYGREGYSSMLQRQIRLARAIARYIGSSAEYELLPRGMAEGEIYIIVLFRARDAELNAGLVKRLNALRRLYVSGTVWEGQAAARFAVASWMVDVERDLKVVVDVLTEVAKGEW